MEKDKKLIVIISTLLVIGFFLTSLASFFVSRKSLRSEIETNTLPLTGDNLYSEIQRDLLQPVFISSLMASDTFLRDWIISGESDQEKITRFLSEIKNKYNTITAFFVSESTKNYYHANGILKKVSEKNPPDSWYFRVRNLQSDYEINVDADMANKDTMTIFVNYRVYDYEGKYIGATGVGLSVNAVKLIIEKYQKKYGRIIYFINKDGDITLADSTFPKDIKNIQQIKNFPEFSHQNIGINTYQRYHNDNQLTHVNIRYINEFNWYLIVEQPESQTTRRIFNTLLINLGICLLVTCIVIFLVNKIIRSYRKKIETLHGIVPICSFCKQVRDDKGYWNQVEAYVSRHTDAKFSHSICPGCVEKHYSEYQEK